MTTNWRRKNMSHLMTNGKPCGLKDKHRGKHRSPESVESERVRHRNWIASYRLTARGMLADLRHDTKGMNWTMKTTGADEITVEIREDRWPHLGPRIHELWAQVHGTSHGCSIYLTNDDLQMIVNYAREIGIKS